MVRERGSIAYYTPMDMEVKDSSEKTNKAFIITIAPEELSSSETTALNELSAILELPGFRKGKVPPGVARAHIKPEALFAKTAEIAAKHAAAEVLAPHADKMVGPPRITLRKAAPGNPLEIRVEADLLPEVDLKDWKKLRIEQKPVVVDPDEIEKSLAWLQKSRAKHRAVVRAAQKGDFVELSFRAMLDGREFSEASSERHPFVLGEGSFIPGFEDNISGMHQGEERVFTLAVPREWPHQNLAGKEVSFTVRILTLHERVLPELNDDFARALGKFENLGVLRQSIREGLLREHEEKERRRVKAQALKVLAAKVPEPIPQALVLQESENLWKEFAASIEAGGVAVEDYLLRIGKNPDELKKELETPARERAKAALVVRAISEQESIETADEEIDAEAAKLLQGADSASALESKVDPDELRAYAKARIRNEKTLRLIYEVVTQKEAR